MEKYRYQSEWNNGYEQSIVNTAFSNHVIISVHCSICYKAHSSTAGLLCYYGETEQSKATVYLPPKGSKI